MTKKTLADRIDEYNALKKSIEDIHQEMAFSTTKIEQLEANLEQLQNQRDELEKTQNNAANLMVSGRMSDDQFSTNKRTLLGLYSQIEDMQEQLELFDKKLNQDDPRRLAELLSNQSGQLHILRVMLAESLAADIAEKVNQQIRELVALVAYGHVNYQISIGMGAYIASAVYGGSPTNPGQPTNDEMQHLHRSTLTNLLGVEP